MDRLSQTGTVRYFSYGAPTGKLYILGDDFVLKSLIFSGSLSRSYNVQKHFHKGKNRAIHAAKNFLDAYFGGIAAPHKPGAGKQTIRVVIEKSTLRFEYGSTVLHMDMAEFTKKEITVYRELLRVPFGRTISYGALAARAGIPGGARFIGNTMAKNNFPIIIPCHRVINADGAMGNYSGGRHIKKLLLEHEKTVSLPLDRAGRF